MTVSDRSGRSKLILLSPWVVATSKTSLNFVEQVRKSFDKENPVEQEHENWRELKKCKQKILVDNKKSKQKSKQTAGDTLQK